MKDTSTDTQEKNTSKIKCCLFDLDGVLLEASGTSGFHFRAFRKALYEASGYLISESYHEQELEGLPTLVKLEKLRKIRVVHKEQIKTIALLKQRYTQQELEKLSVDEEKVEMFKYLKNDLNICTGVCSNSVYETIKIATEKLGFGIWSGLIDVIISNEDVGDKTKPNPLCWQIAMETLNILPSETLIFEDSKVGIESAKASNAMVYEVKSVKEVNKKLIERIISGNN